MTISVLLRRVSGSLKHGHVAGQAQVVGTGETVVFKDQDEMLEFLRQATAGAADDGTASRASSGDQVEPSFGAGQ